MEMKSQYSNLLADEIMEPEAQGGENGENEDKQVVSEIMARCFFPSLITTTSWEGFHFAGHEIKITEATDCYGAVVWPSALVLCHFLETNSKQYNLTDKNVIEIGAGTGLVSIVASLLGARVIATDLPNLLGNLQYNVSRNTKMKCKHQPKVKELSWGIDLEKNFPRSSNHFDYILATDVVYSHPFLDELLTTFDHLCKDTTIILWVMKFRLDKENKFVDRFQELFDLEEISNFPSLNIKLYKAMKKKGRRAQIRI
ncbi:protein-lysine methyltransferase METTL21E-like [Antechinus flavipes]|uniref:protein-lysine methyltransferase METTL21E-like n=1 Tax=Antechinus flavipes TaxID=38775 RepID=UPI00223680A1|nr:protein-lysine methyltransferase METTL21E-like [Antechinus flavipes]XP_051840122.1 protein-lysine methyltransferase METTL21E-like [Antechinus flavipes]